VRLVGEVGLEIERLECYGYPLANVTERIGAFGYAARIRREAGPGGPDRRRNTDRSGIERGPHVRLYPLLRSLPGRLAFAASSAPRDSSWPRILGSGYLLRARRR
jgi:hypothetical protein